MKIEERIRGSLLSGAFADAIGSEFENRTRGTQYSIEEVQSLSITDDTQLTLATCEAIIERKRVCPEAISKHFLRIYKENGIRGIGSSTLKAIRDLEAGAPWYLSGNRSEYAAGNGAAMRIAPIGLTEQFEIEDLFFLVRDISSITHKNDEAYAGALAVCLSIHLLSNGSNLTELAPQLSENLPDTRVRDMLKILDRTTEIEIVEAAEETGTSGYVAQSVPLELFAAIKAQEIGIPRMIEEIIFCGGDTDTTASIAAQVAVTALGCPQELFDRIDQITEAPYILDVVSQFAQVIASRSLNH